MATLACAKLGMHPAGTLDLLLQRAYDIIDDFSDNELAKLVTGTLTGPALICPALSLHPAATRYSGHNALSDAQHLCLSIALLNVTCQVLSFHLAKLMQTSMACRCGRQDG